MRWGGALPFDLFHGTDTIAPAISRPTVITIHDVSTLLFPRHHTRLHRWFDRLSLPRMVKRATAVITDSEATRRDVIRLLGVPPHRVHAIHLGVDHRKFYVREPRKAQTVISASLHIPIPYILAVGTLEPRKNLIGLMQAYALLPSDRPKLVLAGARGWGDNPIYQAARQLGLLDAIQFTGYIPDDVLPSLYAGAQCFVYPSLYEGFGLPALEAMACGAPVITSRTSSLPEVAGDAGLLVDPNDTLELARAMERLMRDGSLRDELRVRGIAQAAMFSWDQTARRTAGVYRLAVPVE
jgi:glycosyltransferase involved in cell wall biosynthesis